MSFKLDKHVKELEYLDLCNGRNRFAIRLGLAIEIEPTQISVGSVCEKFVGTLYTMFPPSCGKKIKGNFKFFRSMETMCMYTVQAHSVQGRTCRNNDTFSKIHWWILP